MGELGDDVGEALHLRARVEVLLRPVEPEGRAGLGAGGSRLFPVRIEVISYCVPNQPGVITLNGTVIYRRDSDHLNEVGIVIN